MHVWRVEVVAVDAPRLVENLRPLGTRIDLHFETGNRQPSFGSIDASGNRHDRPDVAVRVKELLRVRRDSIVSDVVENLFVLPLGEVEPVQPRTRWTIDDEWPWL